MSPAPLACRWAARWAASPAASACGPRTWSTLHHTRPWARPPPTSTPTVGNLCHHHCVRVIGARLIVSGVLGSPVVTAPLLSLLPWSPANLAPPPHTHTPQSCLAWLHAAGAAVDSANNLLLTSDFVLPVSTVTAQASGTRSDRHVAQPGRCVLVHGVSFCISGPSASLEQVRARTHSRPFPSFSPTFPRRALPHRYSPFPASTCWPTTRCSATTCPASATS